MARASVCLGLAVAAVLPGGGHGFLSLQPLPATAGGLRAGSAAGAPPGRGRTGRPRALVWGQPYGGASATAAAARRAGRRGAQGVQCKQEDADDDTLLDRRQLVAGLWTVAGGAAGFGLARLASDSRRHDGGMREVLDRDTTTLREVARLREDLERVERQSAGGKGKEASKTAPDGPVEGSMGDIFAPGNIFAVMLSSVILYLQFKFFRREWQTIDRQYRSTEAKQDFSWGEIVQYRLDLFVSKDPLAKAYIILNGAFLVILLGALLLSVAEGENLGTALWESWTFVADPGTQAQFGEDKPALRPAALGITVAGLITFALLVGLITESVTEQVDNFKKGISKVLDRDHIVMLGWTDKSMAIIEQLAFANESEGGTTIVVLADADKEDMENELRSATQPGVENPVRLYNSKVIFRGGDPLLESELMKVGVTRCRTLIVLSRDDLDPEQADGQMLRQTLSISGALGQRKSKTTPVTIELQDIDNFNLVSLVNLNAEIVVTHDIIGQIMVSCSRQPGLAFLLERAVSFENSEFYFNDWPELHGEYFKELACAFDDAIVLGIKRADGTLVVGPDDNAVYTKGDLLLVLAEDDDSYTPAPSRYSDTGAARVVREEMLEVHEAAMQKKQGRASGLLQGTLTAMIDKGTETLTRTKNSISRKKARAKDKLTELSTGAAGEDSGVHSTERVEEGKGENEKEKEIDRTIFIGWRRDMADMIQALDKIVVPGSELWLFNSIPVVERVEMLQDKGNKGDLKLNNLEVKNAYGVPTLRSNLLMMKSLDEFGDVTGEEIPLSAFQSTLILADEAAREEAGVNPIDRPGVKAIGSQNPSDHHALSTDGRTLATFLLVCDVRTELLVDEARARGQVLAKVSLSLPPPRPLSLSLPLSLFLSLAPARARTLSLFLSLSLSFARARARSLSLTHFLFRSLSLALSLCRSLALSCSLSLALYMYTHGCVYIYIQNVCVCVYTCIHAYISTHL